MSQPSLPIPGSPETVLAEPSAVPQPPLSAPNGPFNPRNQRQANQELLAQFGLKVEEGKLVSGVSLQEAMSEEEEPVEEGSNGEGPFSRPSDSEGSLLEEHHEPPAPAPQETQDEVRRTRQAAKDLVKAERRLKDREAAIDLKLQELSKYTTAFEAIASTPQVEPGATMAAFESDPQVAAFMDAYPDFAMVIRKATASSLGRYEALAVQVSDLAKQLSSYIGKQQSDTVLGEIRSRRADAEQVVGTQEFLEYLGSLPPAIRNTYITIIDNASKYTPEDSLAILDGFDAWRASRGIPVPRPQAPQPAANQPFRQRPPAPGDMVPPTRRGGGSPGTGNNLQPLTQAEFMSYGQLLAQCRTPAERETLKMRRILTLQGA